MPDLLNALFELGGAVAVWLSILAIRRDRCWAGLSIWNLVFFQVWGLWNCFFYPAVGQHLSFIAGLILAASNTIYLSHLLKYRRAT